MSHAVSPRGLLVFPVLQEMSLDEPRLALGPSDDLVLGSSLLDEYCCAEGVLAVCRLPSIHDAEFPEAFSALIHDRRIARVFCPVTSVFAAVKRIISERRLPVEMVGQSPHIRVLSRQQHVRLRAGMLQSAARLLAGDGEATISVLDATALLSLTSAVYGESNDQKFAGFAVALRSAPVGDIVEIGALMGKSAIALGYLAARFGVGQVLAVDPWLQDAAVQNDSPALIKELAGAWDLDEVFQTFQENAAMLPSGTISYFRSTSVSAAGVYANASLRTAAGASGLRGEVALLHVDGNHDEVHVRADCRAWFGYLQPSAWIVLDDYEWTHGAGPKIVGNEMLMNCDSDIRRSFKAGKALFVQVREGSLLKRWALSGG